MIKEMPPAVLEHSRGRTKEADSLITTKDTAHEQLRTVLREAVDRFNHELLPDEERMLLLDRIKRLRKRLALSS